MIATPNKRLQGSRGIICGEPRGESIIETKRLRLMAANSASFNLIVRRSFEVIRAI